MARCVALSILLLVVLSAQASGLPNEEAETARHGHNVLVRRREPRATEQPHSGDGPNAHTPSEGASTANASLADACVALPTGADARVPYTPTFEFTGFQVYTGLLGPNAHPMVDPALFPMRLPGGISGTVSSAEQIAGLLRERAFVLPYTLDLQSKANASCFAASPTGDCITSLESFQRVWYSAFPAKYRPAMADFPFSDAAFARMRLTVDPLVIKAVRELPEGVDAAEVHKVVRSTCEARLSTLLRDGRVFAADYRPLAPLVAASPDSNLQLPVVLFVVDRGEFKVASITLNNGLTYTPLDDQNDWLLAKAYTNALSTSDIAAVHFINNHFVLENLCISLERNLYPKHPLAVLLSIPCKLNAGIIDAGVALLLPPGSIFDTQLAVSSNSLSTKLLPYLANTYDWTANYLANDLASRGVEDIPGYAYAQDAGALFAAFWRYACTYLGGVYASPQALAQDKQLAAFLADVSSGGPAAIGGFPQPSTVLKDVDSLAQVATQVMWLAASHHALNSDKVINYDAVWPSNPSRVWAAPPLAKGTLTEAALLNTYLLPPVLPNGKRGELFLSDAILLGVNFLLDPDLAVQPKGVVRAAYASEPLIAPGCPGARAAAAAAARLNEDLAALSRAIGRREQRLAGTVPPFYLLDPKQLPSWTMI